MIAATALATAREATPALASDAVAAALARIRGTHAEQVLLFLSPEFSPITAMALRAASRAAQCLQVSGAIAPGVLTEHRWSIDGPAVAALVIGQTSHHPPSDHPALHLSLGAGIQLPPSWRMSPSRFGALFDAALIDGGSRVFANGRLADSGFIDLTLPGMDLHVAVSLGERQLSPWLNVDQSHDFELERVAGSTAVDSATRYAPRGNTSDTPRRLGLWVRPREPIPDVTAPQDDGFPPTARQLDIVGQTGRGGFVVADRIPLDSVIAWTTREPIAAEREMHGLADQLTTVCPQPAFGLIFSCIGRGPYFHGGEDRDWLTLRTRFPELPWIGVYGSAQVAPAKAGNRLLRNSTVVALCETRLTA